jgi:hypothetical protein
MKRTAIRIFLVIAICSFAVAVHVYFFRYAGLSRIAPFSTDLSFENSDLDDQFKDYQRGSDACLSTMFLIVLFSGTSHSGMAPHLASLASPLNKRILFLLC